MTERTEEGKAAEREYKKAWRAKNKDKVRETNARYWEKRAAAMKAAQKQTQEGAHKDAEN